MKLLESIRRKLFNVDTGLIPECDHEQVGNINAKNVLILTENINATYYLSFEYPLAAMWQRGEINYSVFSQGSIKGLSAKYSLRKISLALFEKFKPDIVFLSRCSQPFNFEFTKVFKERGIPVIYHIDDNLLEIPKSLGEEIPKRQGESKVIEARLNLLIECDAIYASTKFLTTQLKKHVPNQEIFYGDIYAPYISQMLPESCRLMRSEFIIGYMGSKGHKQDLQMVVGAISRLLDKYEFLKFETFGTIEIPEELLKYGNRVNAYKVNRSYLDFLSKLKSLRWDIGLAPLEYNEFNCCKAPTKYIEYTAAQIPVVASDIPVYSDVISEGCGFLVKDDWFTCLDVLVKKTTVLSQVTEKSNALCCRRFALESLELQLSNIINKYSN